jgi:hypothetical protein
MGEAEQICVRLKDFRSYLLLPCRSMLLCCLLVSYKIGHTWKLIEFGLL